MMLQIDTIRSGMKTIKNMPEQLINTVDEVVEGISKALYGKNIGKITEASSKVGAGIDTEK